MLFDADLKSVDEGVFLPYEDATFKIAHLSNMKFQKALARLQQPHRKKLQEGSMDPEVNQDIVCKAMAEGIIRDWSGVKMRSGADVPFSTANALALLKRDPAFRDWVTSMATDMVHFREEEIEDLGKA